MRLFRLLAVWLLAFTPFCTLLSAQAADDHARVVLFQPSGPREDAALSAALSTVADSVELSLAVLQRYEVKREPALDPATDLEQVKAYCRRNRIDQAILGSGSAMPGGGYRFRLVVYDRKTDRITIDQKGESKGSLDMFDVTDSMVAGLLDALSGRHLAFGSLTVESDPAGATVSVGGKEVGVAPVSLRGLPVGSVEVSGHMDGRETAKTSVTISDGETVSASLVLPRSMGMLAVQMPRDAAATVQSTELGQKKISGSGTVELPTGSYVVHASSPGLPDVSGTVTVTQGESTPWLPWTKGYLDVRSTPAGATISVDGQDVGSSPLVVELDPGAVHHVELRLSGYQTMGADLSEEAGTKAVLSRTLKATAAPSPPARASAATQPARQFTWTTQAAAGQRAWKSIASSSDGIHLAACSLAGDIFTSADGGATWTDRTAAGRRDWTSLASSSDGSHLVACALEGDIFTSSDGGITWADRDMAGSRNWLSVTSSADGSHLAACVGGKNPVMSDDGGDIFTSLDEGATWTDRKVVPLNFPLRSAGPMDWTSIASSADGSHLAASVGRGEIYTSADGGASWTVQEAAGQLRWQFLASSADGSHLAACKSLGGEGDLITSSDGGATWRNGGIGNRHWTSVAFSEDGSHLVACAADGTIFASADGGASWTYQKSASQEKWQSVASSADGNRVAICAADGDIVTGR